MQTEEYQVIAELNQLALSKGKKLDKMWKLTKAMSVDLSKGIDSGYEKYIDQRQACINEIDALDLRFNALCRNLDYHRRTVIQFALSGTSSPDALPDWSRSTAELIWRQRQILKNIMDLDGKNRILVQKMQKELREQLKALRMNRRVIDSYAHGTVSDGSQAGRVFDKKD